MVIVLANGASGVERSEATDAAFAQALHGVCADLSRQIVADGEGVTVLAEITVDGAVDATQAKAIARRIATSPLVKTALFGHDANWGRVLMAAGSAPYNGGYADIDAERATLRYNDVVVLDKGTPTGVEPDVSGPSCAIALELGLGEGSASYLTSDLSYEYVRINGDYRS
jgi:glutamate N-acetyltransferase/amino-acid N-acetyltransferase